MKRKVLLYTLVLSLMILLIGCGSGAPSEVLDDADIKSRSDGQSDDINDSDDDKPLESLDDSVVKMTTVTGVHNISGDIFIYDDNTLVIENFTYDGKAPSTFVVLGHHDDDGFFVFETTISDIIVDAYEGEDYFIEAPDGVNLADYEAVSIYCVQYSENFGSSDFLQI